MSFCDQIILFIFQNIIANDMPKLSVFDLFRETDVEFLARTNWQYSAQSPIYQPNHTISVADPLPNAPQWFHC